MTSRVLVAGVGNLFLDDDGFGVEVAARLSARAVPTGAEIADFGKRGVHLAYELLEGCDVLVLVLVDAGRRGEAPGTLSVIEVSPTETPGARRSRCPSTPQPGSGLGAGDPWKARVADSTACLS